MEKKENVKKSGENGNSNLSTEGLGPKTQALLKKRGVISPSLDRLVPISRKLSLIPNEDVSTPTKMKAWKEKMRVKYKIKDHD